MSLNQDVILDNAQKYTEIVSDDQYQEEQEKLDHLPVVFRNRMWTWDDLEWIVRWKTSRSIGYFERNDRDTVDKAIHNVMETSSLRQKVGLLIELSGIQVKMASAFLLFMNPEEYTVMDWRAADVLHNEGYLRSPISDDPSVDEYEEYVQACQSVADHFEVDLRTLDRGLWVLGGKRSKK